MQADLLRSIRRHHAQRMKAKWNSSRQKSALEADLMQSPAKAGMFVHTRKLCSCWMCGNPRRHEGLRSIQERRALQYVIEEDVCAK